MSVPPPRTPALSPTRVTAVTVTILFVAWIVDYIDRLVIATALPSIGREFGLNHSQQGLLLTAFFITYALFQFPADYWPTRSAPGRPWWSPWSPGRHSPG